MAQADFTPSAPARPLHPGVRGIVWRNPLAAVHPAAIGETAVGAIVDCLLELDRAFDDLREPGAAPAAFHAVVARQYDILLATVRRALPDLAAQCDARHLEAARHG